MKRFVILLITAITLVSFTACGDATTPSSNDLENVSDSALSNDINNTLEDSSSSNSPELLPLELIESSYALKEGLGEYYVQYAIILKNPNIEKAVEFPKVRLTARDANGGVLGTEDIIGSFILPEETQAYASQGPSCDSEPASVDFEIITPNDYNWVDPNNLEYSGESLSVVNPIKGNDKITGEIANNNDYDVSSVGVTVLFRDSDGKILYGKTTYIRDVVARGTTPFELSMWEAKEYMTDDFELYAYP